MPGSTNPKRPQSGEALGALVQLVQIKYEICECDVIDDPDFGTFINLFNCYSTQHAHYELKILRENPNSRTDRLELTGKPDAHEASNEAQAMFIPWTSPAYKVLLESAIWSGGGKAPVNGTLPYGWDGVGVGTAAWSHFPPAGWDDEFGGDAQTGGDHSLDLLWICCDPVESVVHECTP